MGVTRPTRLVYQKKQASKSESPLVTPSSVLYLARGTPVRSAATKQRQTRGSQISTKPRANPTPSVGSTFLTYGLSLFLSIPPPSPVPPGVTYLIFYTIQEREYHETSCVGHCLDRSAIMSHFGNLRSTYNLREWHSLDRDMYTSWHAKSHPTYSSGTRARTCIALWVSHARQDNTSFKPKKYYEWMVRPPPPHDKHTRTNDFEKCVPSSMVSKDERRASIAPLM